MEHRARWLRDALQVCVEWVAELVEARRIAAQPQAERPPDGRRVGEQEGEAARAARAPKVGQRAEAPRRRLARGEARDRVVVPTRRHGHEQVDPVEGQREAQLLQRQRTVGRRGPRRAAVRAGGVGARVGSGRRARVPARLEHLAHELAEHVEERKRPRDAVIVHGRPKAHSAAAGRERTRRALVHDEVKVQPGGKHALDRWAEVGRGRC